MAGFNMPPGCSPSDIPGNRPEDLEAEAREEAACDFLLHALKAFRKLLDGLYIPAETIATFERPDHFKSLEEAACDNALQVLADEFGQDALKAAIRVNRHWLEL